MPGPYRSKKSLVLATRRSTSTTLLNRYQQHQNIRKSLADLSKMPSKDQLSTLNQQTEHGKTLLLLACEKGDVKTVKKLLANDYVNINLPDNHGTTPFMAAFRKGHTHICELLLSDADLLNPVKNRADNPELIDVSKTRGNINEMQLGKAIQRVCDEQGLMTHQPYVSTPEAQALSNTFGRNHLAKHGTTALSVAFDHNRPIIASYLLRLPSIDPFYDGVGGARSLFQLCCLGMTARVKDMLKEIKVHPYDEPEDNIINTQNFYMDNVSSDHNYTPLQVAIVNRHQAIALALIAQPDIDLNLHDHDGTTALLLALKTRQPEIVEALLRHQEIDVTLARMHYGKIINLPIMEAAKHGDLSTDAFRFLARSSLIALRNESLGLYTVVLEKTRELSNHGTRAKDYQHILSQIAAELAQTADINEAIILMSHLSTHDDSSITDKVNPPMPSLGTPFSSSSSSFSNSSSNSDEETDNCEPLAFLNNSSNKAGASSSSSRSCPASSGSTHLDPDWHQGPGSAPSTSIWSNSKTWSPPLFSAPSPLSDTPSPTTVTTSPPPHVDSSFLSDDTVVPNLTDDTHNVFSW